MDYNDTENTYRSTSDPSENFSYISDNERAFVISFVLLFEEKYDMEELRLTCNMKGSFYFEKSPFGKDIFVESRSGEWFVVSKNPVIIEAESQQTNAAKVYNGQLIHVKGYNCNAILYVEKTYKENSIFYNYNIANRFEISIGRLQDNDIVYFNKSASRKHAVIRRNYNNSLSIIDTDSYNGVYVNGKKVRQADLKIGDIIYLVGLKIIVGAGFIAINKKNDTQISLNKVDIDYLSCCPLNPDNSDDDMSAELFNRAPRFRTSLTAEKISIESPPMTLNSNGIPLLLRMGGPMISSGLSALSGNYAMLLSSVLFPLLSQKYTEKERKEYEQKRVSKYTQYLERKLTEIKNEIQNEQYVLNLGFPQLDTIINNALRKEHLWERRKTDDDFLEVRLGTGNINLIAEIDYPKQKFDLDEDFLEEKMYSLAKKNYQLKDVPIITSLLENHVCGITGSKDLTYSFIKRLITEVFALYSYDEVKIVFLIDKEDIKEFEFLKYLPHLWDDNKSVRFMATEKPEAYKIGEYLRKETEDDLSSSEEISKILKKRPYYIVFALSKKLFDSIEYLKDVLQAENNRGISVITVFNDLPKECLQIIEINQDLCSLIYMRQTGNRKETFKMDSFNNRNALLLAKEISNTCLINNVQEYTLPKSVSFLEMFNCGRIEHLNILKRWEESNPTASLSAPVGISSDGSVFTLDLHQKYQGPHGLVAGMTGSGKSEFLLTYILSMAINYQPEEVAFVLIDYKGGGLAGAFDDPNQKIHLPHLIGTITNLDGSTIQRSLISIQSELTRRQRIFNEAKSLTDKGTIDIYSYQKLYRNKVVSVPMPHLFIISDEFAELKQQQPEFMDNLISIARIGRSLGVHLILATQKPSGVVNEQIRSNTKFRVCLKVQDKADSTDMLQRPEAAELKDTGRFYLQVGYNEFFALGQSAWCGAPYEPSDKIISKKDDSIQFVDFTGTNIAEVKPKVVKGSEQGSQLVAIVKMLSEIASEHNVRMKNLWEPELPKKIDAKSLPQDEVLTSVTAVLGKCDDPENQKQPILTFDFTHCQNLMIVGDQGSGKSTLIQTILLSLSEKYSPSQLNYYVLDYSGRMSTLFKELPHCGSVLIDDDINRVDEFFKLINSIVTERKRIFSELETDSFDSVCSVKQLPLILVIIDNISFMGDSKVTEAYLYKLDSIIKNSTNYGIKFIITCNRLSEINSRIKSQLGNRICLHMKDKYEYGDGLNAKISYTPPNLPGRGLCLYNCRPLEVQLSMCEPQLKEQDRIAKIKEKIFSIKENYKTSRKAVKLSVVSEDVDYSEFAEQFEPLRIPLGYSRKDGRPTALPLKQFSMMSVYLGDKSKADIIINNFIYAANRDNMDIWIIKSVSDSLFDYKNNTIKDANFFECNSSSLATFKDKLSDEINERKDIFYNYCENNGLVPETKDMGRDVFDYLSDNCKPLLIFIENHVDLCQNADIITSIVLNKIFDVAGKRNIYFISCFYPNDNSDTRKLGLLYSSFNPDENILLFGGNFEKQSLCKIPLESENNKKIPFNFCLMKYRKTYNVFVMPCGKIKEEPVDKDDESIF